jgi:thiol-disulfide isomerase/thioredoxin
MRFVHFTHCLLVLLTMGQNVKGAETQLIVLCESCKEKSVNISRFSTLQNKEIVLLSARFDSTGIINVQLRLSQPATVLISLLTSDPYKTFISSVYLEPTVTAKINIGENQTEFFGDLALVNTYIRQIQNINGERFAFSELHQEQLVSKSDQQQKIYFDSLDRYGKRLGETIAGDPLLSDDHKNLLASYSNAYEKQQRLHLNFEKFGTKPLKSSARGHAAASGKESAFSIFLTHLPIDPYLLKARESYYIYCLALNANVILIKLLQEYDQDKISKYAFIKNEIRKAEVADTYADFFIALCISTDAVLIGIAYDELLKIVQQFQADYPNSNYIADLQQILDDHKTLSAGMPMKDFSMLDTNGNEFKLSDLKGKIIYIDVWATWCGPCVAEFKYSIKLSEKFAGNNDIVFLYVSKDGKEIAWKKFLQKHPKLKGVHGIQPVKNEPFDQDDIMRLYKINGIPRYIIIGKDGQIIDYNAARPSELLTNSYLQSLLSQ